VHRLSWCIAILQAAHGSEGIFLLVEGKDNIHIVVLSIESTAEKSMHDLREATVMV